MTTLNTTSKEVFNEPTVCIMDITPQMAENWLSHNVENNRHLDNKLVDRYKFTMLKGQWHLSNDAISFNVDDKLVNGQHRLWAIVESQQTIKCIVQKNLPIESMDCMDQGKHRTHDDNFKIFGKTYPAHCAATVRCIFNGISGHRSDIFSHEEINDFMTKYHVSVAWAHEALAKKGAFRSCAFKAVLTRAHIIHKPIDRLNRFCTVLTTGLNSVEDGAALLLRNRVLESGKKITRWNQREYYLLIENALANFLNNKCPSKLLPAKIEMFPIPGIDEE